MKKIGIIGSGVVAKALGTGFVKYGHEVRLGTRDTSKLSEWLSETGTNASAGTFADAAAFGDIIVLAVKGTVAKSALEQAGINHLSGKTIIDATNPISDSPPVNGVLNFFTDMNKSLMEELQALATEGNFVKAYNSIGSHLMVNPPFAEKPTMFIAGNNEAAKKEVAEINDKFGFETEDMGSVEAARAIEPLCMLWCIPGFRDNQWVQAFRFLK